MAGATVTAMAMLPDMLKRDRERWGMSVGEAGWRLGITRREDVAIEDGTAAPNSEGDRRARVGPISSRKDDISPGAPSTP